MATNTTIKTRPTLISDRLRHALDVFFTGLGQGINAYVERRSRMEELQRLDAKTDEELAKMGLTRDEIPRYVFRDLFYV